MEPYGASATPVDVPPVVPAPDPGPPPGAENQPPVIEIDDLHKSYSKDGRKIAVLQGITSRIWPGEMVSLIGPSGVGKSTLLHVLGTLDRPSEGAVRYAGRDVFSLPEGELAAFRNRSVGFVFQFHHLLPDFTALENVMIPGLIAGLSRQEASRRAEEMLEGLGLSHRIGHRPGELSGGEQQRVAIARALVLKPRIILADEPTGNLDEKTADELHQVLFDLNRNQGLTLLLATHSHALAGKLTRHWVMRQGVIIQDERPAHGV